MATITIPGMILTGNHAGRPAASAVGKGSIYSCTTHSLIYQTTDGSTWTTWATLGGTETLPATIIDAKGDLIAGTAADTAAKLTAGANDTILMADSGQSTGLKWVASQTPTTQDYDDVAAQGTADTYARGDHLHGMPSAGGGGGGGVTHAYVGKNAIGASNENAVNLRQYMKKVTLASDCLITSIGAYLRQGSAGNVVAISVGLLDDDANSPDHVIALNVGANPNTFLSDNNGAQGDARWVHMALGIWVPAGDYWLTLELTHGGADTTKVYYDTGGSDQIFTNGAFRITDAGWTTVSDSTKDYSIRASTIS